MRLREAAVLLAVAAVLQGCAVPPGTAPDAAGVESGPETASPAADEPFQRGLASWYGLPFHGRRTASGERFDMNALTAAHPTLPFGTRVKVRSLVNGREVIVRINDRGPYARGRIIDLSHAAARAIGLLGPGVKRVALTLVEPDPG
ncbi:septal ring lytic transglycosylase RlpA family protein [Ramlibacter sp.]|uniref:septal ring lytic transglycosylase RlpA family protein n=1 Tax=Ramlibacter sp. TaxID=1917967 RepID=UPI002D699F77|nr:septal ring lytic transglycosylase RlpA family protein [Ramlibacter sp.]HYD75935.1 septal ring lytic transglycosylase RlpA family protein [Ramlibacter sp.]